MLTLFLLCGSAAAAAETTGDDDDPGSSSEKRRLRASRRAGPVILDGRIDEEAWREAELGAGFTQLEPEPGRPASEATRFLVLFDDAFVYVAVDCADSQPPTTRLSRRDREVDGDYVAWDFDTTLDRRTAYHFQVYAAGQQLDALHFDDVETTHDWDATWESSVRHHDHGWSVEARIPLSAMKIPAGATSFGFDLERRLTRRNEEVLWSYRRRDASGHVSRLGLLEGLDGIRPERTLELRPYLAARGARTDPEPAPHVPQLAPGPCTSIGVTTKGLATACAGADLRYTISGDLALVGTVSPDFGQVEADERVLNLTTFETFIEEKRPFFVEGFDLFEPPLKVKGSGTYGGDAYQLFYSRRIGGEPEEPDLDGGETLLHLPGARPIATALKLSGKVGDASVGAITSFEPRVNAQVLEPGGTVRSERAAEAVHSGALRLRAPFGEHVLAGFTGTAMDPLFARPGSTRAHVASGDVTVFDSDRDWSFGAIASASRLDDNERDVLRDGTVVAPGATGYALSAKAGKADGAFVGFVAADLLSPTFSTNELGYMRRANLMRALGQFQLRSEEPNALWQRAVLTASWRAVWNHALDVGLQRRAGLDAWLQLPSAWTASGGVIGDLEGADDRELKDGTPVVRQGGSTFFGTLDSDGRRALYGGLTGSYGRERPISASSWDASAYVAFRPHPRLETKLSLWMERQDGILRVVRRATLPPGPGVDPTDTLDAELAPTLTRLYLLAPLHARSSAATLRTTMAFSPWLSLQAYAQVFTAGVTYDAPLRGLAAPGRSPLALSGLTPALPADQAPTDLHTREAGVDVTLVLRWEWRLGSTLYLVYAHETSNSLSASPGLSFRDELAALTAPGGTRRDVIMLKVDQLLGQ